MRNASPSFAINYEYQSTNISGHQDTPFRVLTSNISLFALRALRLPCEAVEAKDTKRRKEMKGVVVRMVHEELNREENTNVAVKRHVCTGDVRPREKTEGKAR